MVIDIRENMSFVDKMLVKLQTPKLENKVNFFRLMSITQKAWLWVRESTLTIMHSETHPGMRRILSHIVKQLSAWINLADCLAQHRYFFSSEEIELVRSSETIWNMPEVLQWVAEELENLQKINWKIKSAMTYPIMVLLFAIAAVIILLLKVMPTIVWLFPDPAQLPAVTRFMLWASDFIKEKWYLLLIVPAAIMLVYLYLYRHNLKFKITMDYVILKIPVMWALVKQFNLYRFSKLLWDFYLAWVSPTIALNQISTILKNYHYRKKCLDIKRDLEVWLNFTDSMEGSWIFDQILFQIIWIGETTWNIWEVLSSVAIFYREEVNRKIESMMKIIEPLFMALISVVIWIIVGSVFLPMADLIWTIWG